MSHSRAYIFPGQGSQCCGMGMELYRNNPKARRMFDEADSILGFKISEIMFNGTIEELTSTDIAQPAIFLHSTILAECMDDYSPQMVAGHSLGEYSALVSCGAMKYEDALNLVHIRANAMLTCCNRVPGTMAAIIKLEDEVVDRICRETEGIVVAANYNSPGQIVISGENEAIEAACQQCKAAGAKRALKLSVGGAFHSPLMEPARKELADAISKVSMKAPSCPIYQNVSAKAETDPEIIKENLVAQLTSAVRWTQSVQAMIEDGAASFTEIGPGTVLQGLVKRILPAGSEITINGISTL